MLYSLTDKLKFDENPRMEIKGVVLTVNADAETVLRLMEVVNNEGEIGAMLKAMDLLFSDRDKEQLKSLRLSMADFSEVISTAMSLALGEDPDEPRDTE